MSNEEIYAVDRQTLKNRLSLSAVDRAKLLNEFKILCPYCKKHTLLPSWNICDSKECEKKYREERNKKQRKRMGIKKRIVRKKIKKVKLKGNEKWRALK